MTSLAETEERIRSEERARAAALVRAYADTRPAGEVRPLVQLAHTIETGVRHTTPAPVRTCVTCGKPEDAHPFRHPFRPRDHEVRR